MIERERDDGRLILRIGRDEGAGTALNRMVYNRDLAAVLAAGVVAVAVYGLWLRRSLGAVMGFAALVGVFGIVYGTARRFVFRERTTVITVDREGGTVKVEKSSLFGGTRSETSLAEWGYVRVDEILPRDTADLKDIYRWQEMAEPGVHAKPTAVYRVVVVGRDGRDQVVVHEGQDMNEALEIKKVLTDMRAEVAEAA